jgi:predicted nuclease of predicted toxin-antitoxin system
VTFKIDENLPVETADLLRAAGHNAETVHDESLTGADDPVLAVRVRSEGRVLVTLDLGFSDIRAYPPLDYPGIIVLRSKRQDKQTVLALVARFIPLIAIEPLARKLWIVEADRVRIR